MIKLTSNREYQKVKKSIDDTCGCPSPKPVNGSGSGSGTGKGDCCPVDHDIVSDVVAGAINPLDIVPHGTSLTQFVMQLLLKTFYPTLIEPTFGLTNDSGLKVIGSVSSFTLTFNTNRGEIHGALVGGIWVSTQYQNPLIGVPLSFSYYLPNNDLIATTLSNTQPVTDYTAFQGLNTFSAVQVYDKGPQPVDSKGIPYGDARLEGNSGIVTTSLEGVYPIFGTTVLITTSTQQPLKSMLTANNVEIILVPEETGLKQYFEMPKTWLDSRPLTKIEYFNTVTNQFDPAQKIADFTTSATTKTIEGDTVDYVKHLNTSLLRGKIKIRLIF